ncbi:MAG TPA: amidase family protein [Umezawaea sp.]|nr:amidase family protein [Umezawaea sp.]
MESPDDRLERARASTHGEWIGVAPVIGSSEGPLAGFPFSVKDNIDVAGFPTTAGSRLLPDTPVAVDASVVNALRDAGAVVLGKTNLHELALGITGDNAAFGPTRNPVDPTRSAGGSSGGSAVSVALGLVPFGLGTDTGGSVTIPASFCGVVGFRPTTGRYPGDGVVNLSSSRDTIGVHARTVEVVRTVDEVVTGERRHVDPVVRGLRVGVPRSRYADLDPEVAEVARGALAALTEAGAHLVELDVHDDLALGAGPGIELVLFEAPELLRPRLGATLVDASPREWAALVESPDVRALVELMASSPVTPERYQAARASRWRLRRAYAEAFARAEVDVLIGPTVPIPPPPLGENDTVPLNGRAVPVFATGTRNTAPGTVAGLPMVSLPAGTTSAGLPVGMCLEGRPFDDARLLGTASAVEAVFRRGALG